MICCYKIVEITSEYLLYAYGYDEDHLDGLLKITVGDDIKIEIIRESADVRVRRGVAMKGVPNLIKAYQSGEVIKSSIWACG